MLWGDRSEARGESPSGTHRLSRERTPDEGPYGSLCLRAPNRTRSDRLFSFWRPHYSTAVAGDQHLFIDHRKLSGASTRVLECTCRGFLTVLALGSIIRPSATGTGDETHLSAEQPPPGQDPRVPRTDADERRSPGAEASAGQGAQAPDCVTAG